MRDDEWHSANGQVIIAQGSIRKQIDLIFCQFSNGAQFSGRNNNERTEVQSDSNPLGNKWNHFTIYCTFGGATPVTRSHSMFSYQPYIFTTDATTTTTDRDQWISFSNNSFSWCVGCVECVVAISKVNIVKIRFRMILLNCTIQSIHLLFFIFNFVLNASCGHLSASLHGTDEVPDG